MTTSRIDLEALADAIAEVLGVDSEKVMIDTRDGTVALTAEQGWALLAKAEA